ncbi:GAF domain-containing protein [Chitinilyticum litopenaei]|uniref:GAF domain-containing protein n=1 Tax=Chitinilyticum litopenaei TaxID=1121276 RepID=UPI0003FEFF8D|nr:GAF domain-containing protein [Chitinilyticum litopenaei]
MMEVRLDQIRSAMEGAIPGVLATCSPEGEPNVAFLSQVHYVDENHIALSYQFFNKTRRNILANPHGQLTIACPFSARIYRLTLRYVQTQSNGALYERMKAHLEGIASHTGMSGVFRLLGSDIYEVTQLEALPGNTLPSTPKDRNRLNALRRASESISYCSDMGSLVDEALDAMQREFGVPHAMFLVVDEGRHRLYTLGSRGYSHSGIGSEIHMGDGLIGVCAQAGTPIRISWMTQAYRYSKCIRDYVLLSGSGEKLSTEIPYPGLNAPHSQLAVPLICGGQILGVLLAESNDDLCFTYDDEDALFSLAGQVAACLANLRDGNDPEHESEDIPRFFTQQEVAQTPMRVRYFRETHSIFFEDAYIIKGVAGAILWSMLLDYCRLQRTTFSNRELRMDPRINLPDIVANLEARLILLRKRLDDQDMGVELHKCGRGKLTLKVNKQLNLEEFEAGRML